MFCIFANWQKTYKMHGNCLMPCPIRDHHAGLTKDNPSQPEPSESEPGEALLDLDYAAGMGPLGSEYQSYQA